MDNIYSELRAGNPVILMDDTDRENEGDLVIPAELVTEEKLLFMLKNSTGILCLASDPKRIDSLGLSLMVTQNTDPHKTPFTISIDLDPKYGVTTGVSIADRVRTARALADPKYVAADFTRPGHMFPLRAHPLGLLGRSGHTEGSVELCRRAGCYPVAVISELINPDGTMMRINECREFAQQNNLKLVTINDLRPQLSYAGLPILIRDRINDFRIWVVGRGSLEYVLISKGELDNSYGIPVRIHSECLTGDVFGSLRCDCGSQLRSFLDLLSESPIGLLIYIKGQEGRGIGLIDKIKSYRLQEEQGLDTVEANIRLGHQPDLRDYQEIGPILDQLGIKTITLYSSNTEKIKSLDNRIVRVVPFPGEETPNNRNYLRTKSLKLTNLDSLRPLIGISYTTAWHTSAVKNMVNLATDYFNEKNIPLKFCSVPGSFELIMGARHLIRLGCKAVIVMGVLLKGETYHFEMVAAAVSTGIMNLQLHENVPIIFGVLGCYTDEQIQERTNPDGTKNNVLSWCKTAIDLGTIPGLDQIRR